MQKIRQFGGRFQKLFFSLNYYKDFCFFESVVGNVRESNIKS